MADFVSGYAPPLPPAPAGPKPLPSFPLAMEKLGPLPPPGRVPGKPKGKRKGPPMTEEKKAELRAYGERKKAERQAAKGGRRRGAASAGKAPKAKTARRGQAKSGSAPKRKTAAKRATKPEKRSASAKSASKRTAKPRASRPRTSPPPAPTAAEIASKLFALQAAAAPRRKARKRRPAVLPEPVGPRFVGPLLPFQERLPAKRHKPKHHELGKVGQFWKNHQTGLLAGTAVLSAVSVGRVDAIFSGRPLGDKVPPSAMGAVIALGTGVVLNHLVKRRLKSGKPHKTAQIKIARNAAYAISVGLFSGNLMRAVEERRSGVSGVTDSLPPSQAEP